MKKIITLILCISANVLISQTNRYDEIYTQPYVSSYVPLDLGAIERGYATMQARYDKNKEYRDNLIKWVFDLKTKTDDQQFLNEMDTEYKKLQAMDGQDFGQLGDALSTIKNNISSEIDNCNTRMNTAAKELPKKLWESGKENYKNQKYNDAISDLTQLISIQPSFAGAYYERGICYKALKNYETAIKDFNKLIELDPNNPQGYDVRASTKSRMKDSYGAIADYNKVIELDPTSPYAYYNRGEAKSDLSDEIGAMADFSKAIELKSDFSMAYNDRAWSKFKLKKYNEAITDLNKAILLDNNNWVAYDSRQETKFALNDLKGCIEDCNSAISINSKCSNSYFIRGRAFYKQGNKTKACEDWSKAGELGKTEAYDFIQKYCK